MYVTDIFVKKKLSVVNEISQKEAKSITIRRYINKH